MPRTNPNHVLKSEARRIAAPGSSGFKRWRNNGWTWVEPNGDVVYSLHRTEIVVGHADGSITINNGGWNTVTTKRAINEALAKGPHGRRFRVHGEAGSMILLDHDRPGLKSRRFDRSITYRPDEMEPSRVNPSKPWVVRYRGFLKNIVRYFATEEEARLWVSKVGKPREARISRENPGPYDPKQSRWFHSARGSKRHPKRGVLIQLEDAEFGNYIIRKGYRGSHGFVEAKGREEDVTIYIQTDWDYPPVARTFGWQAPRGPGGCEHDGTDGTINCPDCGMKVGRFIDSARRFLDKIAHDNVVVEDPGYFS